MVSIITGVIGLFLGITLGSIFGKVGSLEILSFILRIPAILIKSPKRLKSKYKIWQELRDLRNIERLKRIKEINALKDEIKRHKDHINELKFKIKRISWELKEPKEWEK